MEVISEKENPLFERKEIVARIPTAGGATPSRKAVLEELAKKYGAKESIVIDSVEQKFGEKAVTVKAKAYSSKETMEKYEKAFKLKRTEESGKKKEEKKS